MSAVRVVIVDDSPVARAVLREILEHDGDIAVVGEAGDGGQAVALVEQLRPDVATIDIQMPDVDGWLATERIMARRPTPILVVTARPVDAALAFEAVRRGALDLVFKPPLGDDAAGRALREHVRLLARTPVVRHLRALDRERTPVPVPLARKAARLVGIAGSAGGPRALATILGGLPKSFPAAIAVVQHLPAGFTAAFARFLGSITPLEVTVVERAAPLRPATVYLAAEDRHLAVSRAGVASEGGPAENGFRPSASVLFRTLAVAFGAGAIGVILSGIGNDGVSGLDAVQAQGGLTIAQNEETSVVYGMPRAAVAAGVCKLVLDVQAIAGTLIERTRSP